MSTLRRIAWVAVLFLVAGALAGLLWEVLWDPTTGVTYKGTWYVEPAGPDNAFSSIALYVVIALPLGIALAVLAGVWRDHEWATAATVVVASVAAGVLMYAVGHSMGPADPQVLAAAKPDYTHLPGSLFTTRYGVLLLAKAVCMALVAVIATRVRFRILPLVTARRTTAIAVWCGLELLVLAAAFGVAVVLTRTSVTPF